MSPFKEKTTQNAFLKIRLAFDMASMLIKKRSIKEHVDYELFMATEYNPGTLGKHLQDLERERELHELNINRVIDEYYLTLERCKK